MIFVFKTNVSDTAAIERLQPHLYQCLKNSNWSFDLEDCDKILRIDSQAQITATAIKVLQDNGYDCEELSE